MHMQLRTGLDGVVRVTLPLRAPKLVFLVGARSALQLQLLRLLRRRRCCPAHALRRVLADPSDGLLVQDTFVDTTMHSLAQAYPHLP